ncbi:ankyrin repeat-containing domain protein [Russula ochroleuca]|uniref:Ankyrin repeat-containing domain protein n=1 Tax=Russula ochroleuca TaxID=152965 RepID=A0A9P5N1N2_9AGAM|nr:ankyrin repeat-containing domain protein [Russula ochroleuca]
MLIECGADVAAQTMCGNTPLHMASSRTLADFISDDFYFKVQGLSEVSRILLEKGADVNAQNKAGLTPLRLLWRSGHWGDTRKQVLLQHGADPGDSNI